VIAVSSYIKVQAQRRLPHDAEVYVINNAPDDRLFSLKPSEKPFILFLGRLEIYQKGLDLLLNAFALLVRKHPHIKLKIAGHGRGSELKVIRNLIDSLGLKDKAELIGFIRGDRKENLLSECLFLCLPSRFEGWPIAAVEAAACQKPVIGTNIPGLSEIVRDGETGLLVPPEDPKFLVKAMSFLIENDQERRTLGEAARKWAYNFKWDIVARRHEEFYIQVLETNSKV